MGIMNESQISMANINDLREYLERAAAQQETRVGWRYSSLWEFVLKKGSPFTYRPFPAKYRKYEGGAGGCFKNSYRLASKRPEVQYVEGFATLKCPFTPILHAWCADQDGFVVDPTWVEPAEYYGVVFPLDYVRSVAAAKKKRIKDAEYGVIDNWAEDYPLLRGEGWTGK